MKVLVATIEWGFGSAWVSNSADGTVSRITGKRVVKTIKVGVEPNGLAAIGSYLWVTGFGGSLYVSQETNVVTRVDARTLKVLGSVKVARNPLGSAIVSNELWVPCIDADVVAIVDPKTLKVVKTMPGGPGPIVVLPVAWPRVGLAHDRHGDLAFVDTRVVELTGYRDRFPILASTTYLINHSLGAMPAEAERRLQQFAGEWAARGARAWGEGWWSSVFTTGDLIGGIIGAPPGSTVMHQNVTVAEAIVLSCFDLKPPRNRIVFEEGLFPSVRYVQQAWARFGAEVVVCEDAEAVIDAIDERTLLVPVSHVLYKSAEIQPIERIVERAHAAGAHVCLDAYQSAGAVPLDVTALGIAFCVGGSVKWLCGGPGAGWLYVRPDLTEQLEPAFAGWQGHARPFAFETEMEPAPGAARFLTGTPNVAANYAASAGYELIAEIGVDRIRANSMRQTALLVELVDAAGFELTSPRDPAIRGGSVVFRVPDFQAVHAELAAREIICDSRPDAGIRFGPHFFTTDDELRFAVDQVSEILASGAHLERAHAAAGY